MTTTLIIGATIPEPTTTAAGTRMMQLIGLFQEAGYNVIFATTAEPTPRSFPLAEIGVQLQEIVLNDESFDVYIHSLNPKLVVFDRFFTEEQFGWRVTEQCPGAIQILDTQDLHFLRTARENLKPDDGRLEELDLVSDTALRELSGIFRCDLTLIISRAEMQLLIKKFGVQPDLLVYLPFIFESPTAKNPGYEARKDFITIGNFHHKPNKDAVFWLKEEIWPLIRQKLPQAVLNVYGDYAPPEVKAMHSTKEGFLIKGWTPDVDEVMKSSRVNLAPLRFGAGLKGKIFDAMRTGTPSVSTSVGAEGITSEEEFPGFIANSANEFARRAIELYTAEESWEFAGERCSRVLSTRFNRDTFVEEFKIRLADLQNDLPGHRNRNIIGRILRYNSMKATKYLSKWIAEKNKHQ